MSEPQTAPTSYLTLSRGTAVVDRFGQDVVTVDRVLVHAEGSFDGTIVRTRAGNRFVDGLRLG